MASSRDWATMRRIAGELLDAETRLADTLKTIMGNETYAAAAQHLGIPVASVQRIVAGQQIPARTADRIVATYDRRHGTPEHRQKLQIAWKLIRECWHHALDSNYSCDKTCAVCGTSVRCQQVKRLQGDTIDSATVCDKCVDEHGIVACGHTVAANQTDAAQTGPTTERHNEQQAAS